ncbi:MAG: shikimate dehydrogenase [Planctomycetes bacterium]|nr:shikimate dehydrogenase [Planctomycetota bacterium]
MICVCIGRGRHKHVIAEHRYLAEQGVRLVELRVDYIRSRLNLGRLLTDRPCPCIITCRREVDGGQWSDSEENRRLVLRTAIAEGVDYIDLEDDIAGEIPRFGKTKRIVSYHNFRETPQDLQAIHERLSGLDPDIVKIATMTHRPSDNQRMLQLIHDAKVPTIGICMGEIGTPTRILAGKFGAPFTYATFQNERKLAPGQLSYKQMRDVFRYDSIDSETEIYGVMADPVAHNLGPIVHNAGFHELKLKKLFIPFRVPKDDLVPFMEMARDLNVKGLSVTVPHKEEIVRYLSQADGSVRGIGAANTVLFDEGAIVGFNTDYRAFNDALDTVFPNYERGQSLWGKTALVLGAGGVSKAILYALRRREADVMVTARTYERAAVLADRFKCRPVQWFERTKVEADIIVNATPIGMHPNVDETPYDRSYLQRGQIVFDTVYNPEQTLLIKHAREQNCRVITGVDMFVRQAALQFEHFTEQPAPEEVMRAELKRAIGAAKY